MIRVFDLSNGERFAVMSWDHYTKPDTPAMSAVSRRENVSLVILAGEAVDVPNLTQQGAEDLYDTAVGVMTNTPLE